MTERETGKQSEIIQLEGEILSLRDKIARANLSGNPKLHFPISDIGQLEKLDPVTVISKELDLPEAGNAVSIKISGAGEWLLDNGQSVSTDIDHVLEEYALATRPDFQELTLEYFRERKERGYVGLAKESKLEAIAFDHSYEKRALNYINANRIPLLSGLKSSMESALAETGK